MRHMMHISYLSTYLATYLPIYLPIYLQTNPNVHLPGDIFRWGWHGASALVLDAQPGALAGQGPRGGQLQAEQRPPGAATLETTVEPVKT